jgi:Homeodomain-like domain
VPRGRGFLASWWKGFKEQRIAGLYSRHIGQVASILTPQLEARILDITRRPPPDGATHWSTRKLGERLGVSHMTVARVWRKHGLKPQRIERYMAKTHERERQRTVPDGLFLPATGRPKTCFQAGIRQWAIWVLVH